MIESENLRWRAFSTRRLAQVLPIPRIFAIACASWPWRCNLRAACSSGDSFTQSAWFLPSPIRYSSNASRSSLMRLKHFVQNGAFDGLPRGTKCVPQRRHNLGTISTCPSTSCAIVGIALVIGIVAAVLSFRPDAIFVGLGVVYTFASHVHSSSVNGWLGPRRCVKHLAARLV